MRRFILSLGIAAFLTGLVMLAMGVTSTPESVSNGTTYVTPTSAPTLPACVTEDGAGQALCWWDAQEQGNGVGTSVVSGDCAPEYVGGDDVSLLCVNLFSRDSVQVDNGDGSSHTIPNGADLVAECVETWNMMDDETAEAEGFTLEECFKAQMES